MASPLPWGEREGVRGKRSSHHPHLHPPPSRGRRVFFELDTSQLCCGVIHSSGSLKRKKFTDAKRNITNRRPWLWEIPYMQGHSWVMEISSFMLLFFKDLFRSFCSMWK